MNRPPSIDTAHAYKHYKTMISTIAQTVSPPLFRTTSTHAAETAKIPENNFEMITNPMWSFEPSNSISTIANQPNKLNKHTRSHASRHRSSSLQRPSQSHPQPSNKKNPTKNNPTSKRRRRRRAESFNLKFLGNKVGSTNSESFGKSVKTRYTYDSRKPGYAFGIAKRKIHAKPTGTPSPGFYAPHVAVRTKKPKTKVTLGKSRRFSKRGIGSTSTTVGPGVYNIQSSLVKKSFNRKLSTFGSCSKRFKHGKKASNQTKVVANAKFGAMSHARRFQNKNEASFNGTPGVCSYNVPHILNHDRQGVYFPVSNSKIASKIVSRKR